MQLTCVIVYTLTYYYQVSSATSIASAEPKVCSTMQTGL